MASYITFSSPTQRTDFTSIPRELRDKIYELTLKHAQPITRGPTLRRILNGVENWNRTRAYALLSPKASTSEIAREALEYFYAHNAFRVLLVESPNRHLIRHDNLETGKDYIQELIVDMWDALVHKPTNMSDFLAPFLDYPSLRCLTMVIAHGQNFENVRASQEDLKQGLKFLAAACEGCDGLSSRLGDGLQFDIDVVYIRGASEYHGGSRMLILRTIELKCGLDRLKQVGDDLDSFEGSS